MTQYELSFIHDYYRSVKYGAVLIVDTNVGMVKLRCSQVLLKNTVHSRQPLIATYRTMKFPAAMIQTSGTEKSATARSSQLCKTRKGAGEGTTPPHGIFEWKWRAAQMQPPVFGTPLVVYAATFLLGMVPLRGVLMAIGVFLCLFCGGLEVGGDGGVG